MKTRLIMLALILAFIPSLHASWYVDASAAASHLGGPKILGPYPTKAAAQAACDADPGYGLTVMPGGTDDTGAASSGGANASGLTIQQQIGGLAAQQMAINMHASPVAAAAGVGFVEGLLTPQQPDPHEIAAQQAQLAAQQLNNSGNYLYHKKDYAGAINEYQQALAQTPNDQIIAQNLANAKQMLAKQQQDTAAAAQTSSALGQLLGNVPANSGNVNLFGTSQISTPNSSPLNLVNLDSDPNVVDLRGTTKTYVDPAVVKGDSPTQPANAQQTVQALDNLLDNSENEAKKQLDDFAKNYLPASEANPAQPAPGGQAESQTQSVDPAQTVKELDQDLGQNQPSQVPQASGLAATANSPETVSASKPPEPPAVESQPQVQSQSVNNSQTIRALDQDLGQPAQSAQPLDARNEDLKDAPSDNTTGQKVFNISGVPISQSGVLSGQDSAPPVQNAGKNDNAAQDLTGLIKGGFTEGGTQPTYDTAGQKGNDIVAAQIPTPTAKPKLQNPILGLNIDPKLKALYLSNPQIQNNPQIQQLLQSHQQTQAAINNANTQLDNLDLSVPDNQVQRYNLKLSVTTNTSKLATVDLSVGNLIQQLATQQQLVQPASNPGASQ